MIADMAWELALGLGAGGVIGGLLLGRLRHWMRLAVHAESERAWTAFGGGLPHSLVPDRGEEFYCRCGRHEVVAQGSPPPTCDGVSCVGTEHELRVMHPVAGP